MFWVGHIFWLVVSTPLKNMKVSWDDDIPNIWKVIKVSPNHQPVVVNLFSSDKQSQLHRFRTRLCANAFASVSGRCRHLMTEALLGSTDRSKGEDKCDTRQLS